MHSRYQSGKTITVEEYENLPNDGTLYELRDGRLVPMSPTGWEHDNISFRIVSMIGYYILTHGLGQGTLSQASYLIPVPGRKEEGLVPDFAFVRPGKVPEPNTPESKKAQHLVPDLVLEVISPNDTPKDVRERIHLWRGAGVELLWVVWPNRRRVEVWTPERDIPQVLSMHDSLDGQDIVPGFRLRVSDIFP